MRCGYQYAMCHQYPLGRALFSASPPRAACAPYEAIFTPPPVLFDRALLFEAGKDRAVGATRSSALGQLNGMFNQGAEFHRLFGHDRVACGNVSRGASPGTQASALPPSMTATGSKRHDVLPMGAKRTGNE